jgi:hypothetical protein
LIIFLMISCFLGNADLPTNVFYSIVLTCYKISNHHFIRIMITIKKCHNFTFKFDQESFD